MSFWLVIQEVLFVSFTFPMIQMMEATFYPAFSDTPLGEYYNLNRRRMHAPLPPSSGIHLPALERILPTAFKSDIDIKRYDTKVTIHF